MNVEGGLILDTHVWIWWVDQDTKLPVPLAERIAEAPQIAISAASILRTGAGRGAADVWRWRWRRATGCKPQLWRPASM